MMNRKIITVRSDGSIQFIYDDKLRGLLREGQATIVRASHVEPGDESSGQDPLKWYADLGHSRGPVLGPFDSREYALDAEVAWLNENVLGTFDTVPASSRLRPLL